MSTAFAFAFALMCNLLLHWMASGGGGGATSFSVVKLLEENVNLSLNLYDYREDVVERTRIKQRQFLEQFNDSLSEFPEVPSPSNSPPRPSRRNEKKDHTITPPSSSALLSTLTSRLWQKHTPLSQPKNEYDDDDDDGAW